MTTVILLALASSALWGVTLWLRPFGPCPKCKGTGNIQRGGRRRSARGAKDSGASSA
jgi:hypothetical protein